MKRATGLLLVLLALPLISGCPLLRWLGFPVGSQVPYNPKAGSGDVSARKDVQFPDIPVPLGFVLRRDQVFSFRGHTFRFGRFVYEGAWTMRNTTGFYLEQMPVSGWEFVSTQEDGFYNQTQLYAKGKERCQVRVQSKTDGMYVTVRVFNERDLTPDGDVAGL